MKKFIILGKLGKHLFDTGKNYYKAGGKKTKTIMAESNVTKEVAKADIKDEIKRKVFQEVEKNLLIFTINLKEDNAWWTQEKRVAN